MPFIYHRLVDISIWAKLFQTSIRAPCVQLLTILMENLLVATTHFNLIWGWRYRNQTDHLVVLCRAKSWLISHFKYTFPRLKGVDSEEGAKFPRWGDTAIYYFSWCCFDLYLFLSSIIEKYKCKIFKMYKVITWFSH